MRVAVPKEIESGEKRVAIVPETVKRLAKKGIEVCVESGAGEGSCFRDGEYEEAGAAIEPSAEALLAATDVVIKIQRPTTAELLKIREGTTIISLLYPMVNQDLVQTLAARKITAIAVDSIPRTTLAQMMDVLSSQATIAGYYAVIMAAYALPKFFPMLMTAAGTIAPAKVLILGAGVAGLQAIATAKRLGASVEAFDTRKVVRQQVESLGARFVEVDIAEDAQTSSGYAKELSDEYKRRQAELLHRHIAKSDVCITTALIPGQRAPILIPEEMVQAMRPGSVIVDLAAEQGGNCALTEPGNEVVKHGVTIIGRLNLPSRLAVHASQMYSRNMEKLLLHLMDKDGGLKLNLQEEITQGCVITLGGEVVQPKVKELLSRKGESHAG
ncbi:MAG TPA: Re/Si-specific NAD(P)(+) transhydrogenase subunit alpha [Patescibacteria group bacterium]|nr:Re/Si-specific NAD(P)(+) transhydrogenase subunit alpha [Patescibacteria group bacterium]